MLIETVTSILKGHDVPTELLVMDQSDEENEALARIQTDRPCKIRYCWTRSVGLSRANNTGIAAAQHEILAFTHDDVTVTPDWFGTLVRSLVEAGPRAVVTGKVRPAESDRSGGFVPSIKTDERPDVYRERLCEGLLYPMNMAMYRSLLFEVGVFDERLGPGTPYPAAEDNDLCDRILRKGYEVHYLPDAVLDHRAWRSERDYLPLRWAYGRGQGAFYGKLLRRRDWHGLRCVRSEFRHRLWRIASGLRHDRCDARGEVVYLLGLLAGLGQWMVSEREKHVVVD